MKAQALAVMLTVADVQILQDRSYYLEKSKFPFLQKKASTSAMKNIHFVFAECSKFRREHPF